MSKPRHRITQLHRPAKLKLERWRAFARKRATALLVVPLERFFPCHRSERWQVFLSATGGFDIDILIFGGEREWTQEVTAAVDRRKQAMRAMCLCAKRFASVSAALSHHRVQRSVPCFLLGIVRKGRYRQ